MSLFAKETKYDVLSSLAFAPQEVNILEVDAESPSFVFLLS